ncbi:MAG: helix-turn-helix domain-containing protein [Candidatus Acidiferrum sp.]
MNAEPVPRHIAWSRQYDQRRYGPARLDAEDVRKLAKEGIGPSEIAQRLEIGRSAVYRILSA